MRARCAGRADPAWTGAAGLRELRAVDACARPGRPGARRLPGEARGDRGHVPADLSRRIGRAAGAVLGQTLSRRRASLTTEMRRRPGPSDLTTIVRIGLRSCMCGET